MKTATDLVNEAATAATRQRKVRAAVKRTMTFIEILESEHYHLIEALEHGCSDPEVIEYLKAELKEKTGWDY